VAQIPGGSRWDLVVANLPYLPSPGDKFDPKQAREVDGGREGTRFVPRIFEIAAEVGATAIILNTSSLCNLEAVASLVRERQLGVYRVVATLAPLEEYAQKVKEYLTSTRFARVFGPGGNRQIIYAVELRKDCGVDFSMMVEQTRILLRPDVNQEGTMAVGVAAW
jgi:hypothetical protein